MIKVSNEWKDIMSRPVRNRAFISVGIGVINQDAQESAIADGDFAYWSRGNVFNTSQSRVEYATLEENYLKADGKMLFMPENDEYMQLNYNGLTTENPLGAIRIDFPNVFSIKGLTLDFGSAYPLSFTIHTKSKRLLFSNDKSRFVTNAVLGDTDYILITPINMVGGQQRFRLQSILMGVGLQYSNAQTKTFNMDEYVSSISEDLPCSNLKYTFYDEENNFDVDDDNSFIDFLDTMQKVTVSFGLEHDDGKVEWKQIATQYLKDWKSQKGIVDISATDRLSQMEDEYTLANRIYDRTAYDEAESIFTDAGLQPDEYFIDEYLRDVPLHNPMPNGTHKECLQILANACRSIIRQDENGRIQVVANFATVLDPDDLQIETNGVTEWSAPDNLLLGTSVVYAEMSKDFLRADGAMYFMPEDGSYLDTGYVSEQVADENGLFDENPTIAIVLPASYTYYGLNIDFGGNPPEEMIIHTYKSDELQESVQFTDMTSETALFHRFGSFDKMVFEFTKGYPQNRVVVNRISFGDLSDYVLTKTNMLESPIGYKEKRVKAVKCKIFTYELDEDGKPQEIEDNVFAVKVLNEVGEIKTIQNPLVSTQAHAELLAEWIGNYYANNISYDVRYRGEPRINAADIIHMESEKKNNLQVEITRNKLTYDGAFSGELELRRALKMTGA